MKNKNLFILIGLFWLAIIAVFIGVKEFTLRTGEEVLLKTVPVDPRDLFRGDYIILRYEIGSLYLDKIPTDGADFKINDTVFVTLEKENGYGTASGAYDHIPAKDKLFVKGRVYKVSNRELFVEYGIESYFVPEGKGRRITGAAVKASIDKFGNAAIKSLSKDGKELSFK
jgi:uncharacterized membrane-anchored protein